MDSIEQEKRDVLRFLEMSVLNVKERLRQEYEEQCRKTDELKEALYRRIVEDVSGNPRELLREFFGDSSPSRSKQEDEVPGKINNNNDDDMNTSDYFSPTKSEDIDYHGVVAIPPLASFNASTPLKRTEQSASSNSVTPVKQGLSFVAPFPALDITPVKPELCAQASRRQTSSSSTPVKRKRPGSSGSLATPVKIELIELTEPSSPSTSVKRKKRGSIGNRVTLVKTEDAEHPTLSSTNSSTLHSVENLNSTIDDSDTTSHLNTSSVTLPPSTTISSDLDRTLPDANTSFDLSTKFDCPFCRKQFTKQSKQAHPERCIRRLIRFPADEYYCKWEECGYTLPMDERAIPLIKSHILFKHKMFDETGLFYDHRKTGAMRQKTIQECFFKKPSP